jgi:hypothetical protein
MAHQVSGQVFGAEYVRSEISKTLISPNLRSVLWYFAFLWSLIHPEHKLPPTVSRPKGHIDNFCHLFWPSGWVTRRPAHASYNEFW